VFRILIVSAYFTFLNINLAPFIYANKQDKFLTKLFLYMGLLFLFVCFIASKNYSAIGTSLVISSVEILIFFFLIKKIGDE
jgi:O-antigen/teichoic acid export membrane protein